MSNPVKRIVTIVMDATVENYNHLNALVSDDFDFSWETTSTFDILPQDGEVWKDGYGEEHLLKVVPSDDEYPLHKVNNNGTTTTTWKEDGVYHSHIWNRCNLMERVSKRVKALDIHPGEYWMDRSHNIHLIKQVDASGDFPIRSSRHIEWTEDGKYSLDRCSDHDGDLIWRVKVSIDCPD